MVRLAIGSLGCRNALVLTSMSNDKPAIAARILDRREALDLSQEKVARLAGISLQQMGRIERGVSDPKLSTAKAIADALNLTLDELLDGSGVTRRPRRKKGAAPQARVGAAIT